MEHKGEGRFVPLEAGPVDQDGDRGSGDGTCTTIGVDCTIANSFSRMPVRIPPKTRRHLSFEHSPNHCAAEEQSALPKPCSGHAKRCSTKANRDKRDTGDRVDRLISLWHLNGNTNRPCRGAYRIQRGDPHPPHSSQFGAVVADQHVSSYSCSSLQLEISNGECDGELQNPH